MITDRMLSWIFWIDPNLFGKSVNGCIRRLQKPVNRNIFFMPWSQPYLSIAGWWFDGEVATAILNPFDAVKARTEAQKSLADAQRLYPSSSKLPKVDLQDQIIHESFNIRQLQGIYMWKTIDYLMINMEKAHQSW